MQMQHARCMACWLRERGEGAVEAVDWVLFFPDNAVAVILADGVFVDWDVAGSRRHLRRLLHDNGSRRTDGLHA